MLLFVESYFRALKFRVQAVQGNHGTEFQIDSARALQYK